MIEAEHSLRAKLLEFATSGRYDADVARAFDLYWSGKYTIDNAPELDQLDHARFLEYYLFDYRLAEHDMTPVDLFDEYRGYTLSEDEQRLLGEWSATVFGVFLLCETTDAGTRLHDVFDDSDIVVVNPELAELPDHCLLVGRVITVFGVNKLSGAVSTLSNTVIDVLREFLEARFELFIKESPGAAWRDFFRTEHHGLQHLLMEMRIKADEIQWDEPGVN